MYEPVGHHGGPVRDHVCSQMGSICPQIVQKTIFVAGRRIEVKVLLPTKLQVSNSSWREYRIEQIIILYRRRPQT